MKFFILILLFLYNIYDYKKKISIMSTFYINILQTEKI